jgi:tRNA (guanine37-N1)-methyltransferase
MVRFDAITLFPAMFASVTVEGICGRAHEQQLWRLQCWSPRDYADNAYRTVDDRPYGGGPGMVMTPKPLEAAIDVAKAEQEAAGKRPKVLYLSPQGERLNHAGVIKLRDEMQSGTSVVLLCGRYEGIDERVITRRVDGELSVGDYVLSGGELAAMVLIDCVVRQLPGVLNDDTSAEQDSFVNGLLDCAHYTRPEEHAGLRVPDVLLSGNHKEIARWRLKQSLVRTMQRRPELVKQWAARVLSKDEVKVLADARAEAETAAKAEFSKQP